MPRAADAAAQPVTPRYVALLRGVNVGGKALLSMADLRACFEEAGYGAVETYINSGNVLFTHPPADPMKLAETIERHMEHRFGFDVPVLVKTAEAMTAICQAIPAAWTNDRAMKTDVLFLWPDVDDASILEALPTSPGIDHTVYAPGAVIWNVDRKDHGRSKLPRIIGTPLYRKLTIRNVNTTRTLARKLGA